MRVNRESGVIIKGDRELVAILNGENDTNLINVITSELYYLLERLCLAGKTTFHCYTAQGFDLLAIEQLLSLKKRFPQIEVIAYLSPDCKVQTYSDSEKRLYNQILTTFENVEFIDNYPSFVENVLAQVTEVVTYCSGDEKESVNLVEKATERDLVIDDIYDLLNDYFTCMHPAKLLMQAYPDATGYKYGKSGIIFAYEGIRPLLIDFVRIASVTCVDNCFTFTLANGREMSVPIYGEKDPCIVMPNIPEILSKDFLKNEGIEFDELIKDEAEANEAMGNPTSKDDTII